MFLSRKAIAYSLVTLSGWSCWAQTSTAIKAEAPQQTILENATMTSKTHVSAADASTWHLTLSTENYMYGSAQDEFGAKAPVYSLNAAGALYKINSKWGVELRQYFQYASNKENLSGRDKELHQSSTELSDTLIKVGFKPGWTLWGSKPLSHDLRYYAPTDRVSQNNEERGKFRSDNYTEWTMTPKWAVTGWLSARVGLPNALDGNNEYYQMKLSPGIKYYVNDSLSGYYNYTANLKAKQASRGNWNPDGANEACHEVGAWVSFGAFDFNPSLMSDVNHNNSDASLFAGNARVFAHETLTYNLNLYASF